MEHPDAAGNHDRPVIFKEVDCGRSNPQRIRIDDSTGTSEASRGTSTAISSPQSVKFHPRMRSILGPRRDARMARI
jgi:hypothetical protein